MSDFPILEHDPSDDSALHPHVLLKPHEAMPQHVVFCFFQDVIRAVVDKHPSEQLHLLGSEIGPNPVYAIKTEWGRVALLHPGVGAPMAAAFSGCAAAVLAADCAALRA